MRSTDVDKKDSIRKMKSMLVDDEHLSLKSEFEKKHFYQKSLAANDWFKDKVVNTLVKISEIHHYML